MHDLSFLGKYIIKKSPGKMATDCLEEHLYENCWFAAIDLTNGYWHVDVHPESQPWFGFKWKGQNYTWSKMPFGWHNAPYEFVLLMETVHRHVTKLGIKTVFYMDDWIIIANSYEAALYQMEVLIDVMISLGFKVNRSKCVLPTQEICFLGNIYNSQFKVIKISPKIAEKFICIYLNRTNDRELLKIKLAQHIFGLLGAGWVVRKSVFAWIVKDLAEIQKTKEKQIFFDWVNALCAFNWINRPRIWKSLERDIWVMSDASNIAMGWCTMDESIHETIYFSAEGLKLDIADKELIAAIYTLEYIRMNLKINSVGLWCDNQNVVSWFQNGYTKSVARNEILIEYLYMWESKQFVVEVKWIATDKNLADKWSRPTTRN